MDAKKYLSKENVESIWELSLVQKETFQQIDSGTNRNNHSVGAAFIIKGHLEPDKIQRAWEQTVCQTPILRTVFRNALKRTVQVVLKEYPIPIEIIDANIDVKEPENHRNLAFILLQEHSKTFNPIEEPPINIKLLRFTDEKAIILLIAHRIILDKESIMSVFQDFMSIYSSIEEKGSISSLPRTLYKDYLDWLGQQYWAPALTYWKQELADFNTPTSLVQYQRFKKNPTHSYSFQQHGLSEEQSRGVETMAQVYGVSPAIVVQAAWALLLNLYSREKQIYFGVDIHGLPAGIKNSQDIIGPLTNHLPLHVTIDPEQSLQELMIGISEKNQFLLKYSFIPLEEIRAKASLPSDLPLFESNVSVNPDRTGLFKAAGTIQVENVDSWQYRDFPFTVEVTTGKRWQLRFFCFDAVLSNAAAIQVLKRLAAILEGIRKNPGARLSQLNYITASEQEKLREFNRSEIRLQPLCLESFMHQDFEKQVKKTPMTIACTWREHQVSYGELNARANRWAHCLKEQGIGPNHLVGVFCERSIEMLTAILAVFKAGGAYIPLDPANPDSRLKTVIADSRIKVIFTRTSEVRRTLKLVKDLPVQTSVFCLEPTHPEYEIPDASILPQYPADNLPSVSLPGSAAYVIFTSGSTGHPKGVVVEHIGMLNHLWTKIELLHLSRTSKVAQNASHCFDISVWQFLAALMTGGQTIIFDNQVAMDPILLLKSLRNYRVTILEMVPAVIEMMLQQYIETSAASDLKDIRYMLSTGEAFPTALCQKWQEKYLHITVVNAYGPTECSDDTHHCIVSTRSTTITNHAGPQENNYNEVPLGKIIPNFNCYILDEYMRQVPCGCAGEIFLTGVGVAKGYLNDPERTADAFVGNPFDNGPGKRMYRTGDLGYIDVEGQLVFLGRIDHQVKIRGHRIELGEIENQLRKHHRVKQCTAVTRDSETHKQIIAYVVLKEKISPLELRKYLQEQLPDYMLPQHIIELEALPLNRSGKIDRQALPDPDHLTQSTTQMELPVTPMEKTLAQIWEDILEVSPLGMNHNFFQLGGHSLSIIQVKSRINQQLGVNIPIIELFGKQTLRQQVQLLEELAAQANAPGEQQIPRLPEASYYPMSHAQQRLFFVYQIEPENTAYNLSTTIESRQPLHLESLNKALQEITDRQATLRTTFGLKDNKPVQYVARQYEVCFKFEDISHIQSTRRGQMLEKRLQREVNFKFDLTKGPLFYTIVFKIEEQHHLLFFHMHHIISDLRSWEIFFKELFAIYESYINGTEVSLPKLDIQYTDYSSWQNKKIENGDFQVHADYWQKQLSGELPVLELPLDFPRPGLQVFRGGTVSGNIPEPCVKKLHQLFQQKNVTSFIGLIAAFFAFLSGITGQQDIIVGTPEVGRDRIEIENLIGFFVNTLPMRVNLEEAPTFLQLLNRVKEVCLQAYEHAEYPFDLIISQLNLERDLSRHPLFTVMFQVNEERGGNALGNAAAGFSLYGYNIAEITINFDLHVIFTETDQNLQCNFSYCKDLFKEETIQRWMEHFIVFLEAAAISPETKISCVPMLTQQQKKILLFDWNTTHMEYPRDQTVHSLFKNQVDKTPDATALVYQNQLITYQQLNRQANQLSHLLYEKGFFPGSILGIHMERCLNMVVAMLGVLKAGAAYIPLDPALPMERLKQMIADANVSLLLTSPLQSDKVEKELTGTAQICISNPAQGAFPGSERFERFIRHNPDSTAYIIYTSGSTGIPKGVQISHPSLINFICAIKEHFICQNDILLAVTNFTFDISFLELLLPLTAGSRVVIAGQEEICNGELLRDKLATACVTVMQGTPATWKLLLRSEWPGTPYLKSMVGGEPLSLELAQQVVPKCHSLWNMYGPTEATIWASFCKIPGKVQSISIGRPIYNTQMYILNPALSPVPVGVTGELYIGGICLADGYVNAPELTAETFIPSPFAVEIKSKKRNRLYKTGDLVRYRQDGYIEFLGRKDNQVKIRGYRIELKEIESHLLKKDNINEAVVLVKKDRHNETYLCAYIMFESACAQQEGTTANSSELREYLAAQLPRYMLPDQFVTVDRIPVTPSGKIDQKALASMGENIGTGVEYQPPRNIIETLILSQWKEVLDVDTVSINDNFFQLGGHSITAIRLISTLKANGIHISASEIFRYQNIKDMAQYVMETSNEGLYLIKTREEALQIFKNQFNTNGEFVTYHVGKDMNYVFYVEDTFQTEYKRIARFFSNHLSREINPHFIKPISQKPPVNENDLYLDNREFTNIMQLKNDTPELSQHIAHRLKEELAKFNETIVTNQTVNQYKLSPIQQGHLTLENRFPDFTISFDKHLDIQLLEETFLELIQNQGLLRSTPVKKNGKFLWNEFSSPQRITIPYIDLMEYDLELKEKLISQILDQLPHQISVEENSVLYRVLLIKKDLKNHLLVISIHHLIFDATSMEIIKNNLINSYHRRERNQNLPPQRPKPKSYSDYIQQISRGPLDINEDELIEIFDLEAFCKAKRKFEKITREKENQHINVLNYDLPFTEGMTDENAWEISFFVFNIFLKKYFGLSKIPLKIVSYGRRYRQNTFFDTVGEFIDLVPVLVHVNEKNPAKMFADARRKLDKVIKHNINFMSIMYDQLLKKKWKKAAQFLEPEQLDPNDPMVLFNFVGKAAEEQIRQFKPVGTAGKESKISTLFCEIYYTSKSLFFNISTSLAINKYKSIKISAEELKRIINSI